MGELAARWKWSEREIWLWGVGVLGRTSPVVRRGQLGSLLAVANGLTRFTNGDLKAACPAIDSVAAASGCSISTVKRMLALMRELQVLDWKSRKAGSPRSRYAEFGMAVEAVGLPMKAAGRPTNIYTFSLQPMSPLLLDPPHGERGRANKKGAHEPIPVGQRSIAQHTEPSRQPEIEKTGEVHPALRDLVAEGVVTRWWAERWTAEHTDREVRLAVAKLQEQEDGGVKNPGGFLQEALRSRYVPSEQAIAQVDTDLGTRRHLDRDESMALLKRLESGGLVQVSEDEGDPVFATQDQADQESAQREKLRKQAAMLQRPESTDPTAVRPGDTAETPAPAKPVVQAEYQRLLAQLTSEKRHEIFQLPAVKEPFATGDREAAEAAIIATAREMLAQESAPSP